MAVGRREVERHSGALASRSIRLRAAIAAAIAASSLTAAAAAADSRADILRSFAAVERRALAAELGRQAELARRLDAAIGELSAASRAASDAGDRAEGALAEAAERLSRAALAVEAAALDQRLGVERIALLRGRIGELDREAAAARPGAEDPISGDWHIRIDPGGQEGTLHLSLEGTLVGGSYALEAGMSGSVRGTYVGDRIRFDRVDSKLGFSSVFYGRVAPDGTVTGTWEATDVSGGGPSSGTWSAVKRNEGDEH